MKKFSWMVLLFFLIVIFPVGCTGGQELPCPISKESMEIPEKDFVAYKLQNDACVTFCDVSIAPSRCNDWGFDWIGNDSWRTGESLTVFLPLGKYDVLLEDCTDLSYNFKKQLVNGENGLQVSDVDANMKDGCQASLTVVNNYDVPICHMWIGADHSDYFGGNWLGEDQIAPGEMSQFFVFPGLYDLKAEDCDFNILRLEIDVLIEDHLTWEVE